MFCKNKMSKSQQHSLKKLLIRQGLLNHTHTCRCSRTILRTDSEIIYSIQSKTCFYFSSKLLVVNCNLKKGYIHDLKCGEDDHHGQREGEQQHQEEKTRLLEAEKKQKIHCTKVNLNTNHRQELIFPFFIAKWIKYAMFTK